MNRDRRIQQALRALDDFRRDVSEQAPDELDCDELEQRLSAALNQIGREVMGEVLERADTQVPLIEFEGQRWGNRRQSASTYTSRFGDVEVVRSIYSRGGGGRVLVPLDLRLGIIERRYTPALARVMARATALMTSQEAEGLLREVGLAMVSRSTLHRVPQAVAARYETRRELLEQALRERDSVPDSATVVQVSLDGVMVPQEGEREKPRGRKVQENQPARHERRYGVLDAGAPANHNGATNRSWHEAMVGTMAFWDREGQHLKTVYVARMPESRHETVAHLVEQELLATLSERPDLDVSFASDGDELQWTQLEAISARLSNQDLRRTTFHLDFYHAASYVHAAATAAFEDASAARVQAQHWLALLKEYENGADRMLKSMYYHRDRIKDSQRRADMAAAIRYLAKQDTAGRMKYKAGRDLGHPIGTGPTEAAAKTLVNVRMKRAGARYSQHGGQTILTFRAALYSERFEALWKLLHDSYKGKPLECAA